MTKQEIKNPYSLSEAGMKMRAQERVNELLSKGFTIEKIKEQLLAGVEACNRKIKRNSFNIDAIAKKEWLSNQIAVINTLNF